MNLITNVFLLSINNIIIPNWQHHSKKDARRTLKPQAVRDSKQRLKALITKLNSQSSRLWKSM